MGKIRSEVAFRHRLISQPEFDRNIVKPARPGAAIEMTQARHDHSDDGDLNVGPRLIEDGEVEACTPGAVAAGIQLLAGGFQWTEFRTGVRLDGFAAGGQERVLPQLQRRDAVEAGLLPGAASHQTDREELIKLR